MRKKLCLSFFILVLVVSTISGSHSAQTFQITGIQLSANKLIRLVPVTVSVTTSSEGLFYQFWIADKYGSPDFPGGWQIMQAWSSNNTYTWIPAETGRYVIVAWVDDDLSETDDYETIGLSTEVVSATTVTVDITGDYTGTVIETEGGFTDTYQADVTLSQTGTDLSGTWSNDEGEAGTVEGTVAADAVATFTLTQQQPCAGSYSGTINISNGGNTLTGTYTGTYCGGSVRATFTLNGQQ